MRIGQRREGETKSRIIAARITLRGSAEGRDRRIEFDACAQQQEIAFETGEAEQSAQGIQRCGEGIPG
jgi:hypothetical protein